MRCVIGLDRNKIQAGQLLIYDIMYPLRSSVTLQLMGRMKVHIYLSDHCKTSNIGRTINIKNSFAYQ